MDKLKELVERREKLRKLWLYWMLEVRKTGHGKANV